MSVDPSNDQYVTLGEVWRTLQALRKDVERMETSLGQEWLTKEVYDVRHRELEHRTMVIETRLTRFESRRFAIAVSLLTIAGTSIGALIIALVTAHSGR